jgi:hypothetical protein
MVGGIYAEQLKRKWPETALVARAKSDDFMKSMIAAIANKDIAVFDEAVD